MFNADGVPAGRSYDSRRSKQFVPQVEQVVVQTMAEAAPAPSLEIDLIALRCVLLEDRVELLRGGGVGNPQRELVVDLERSIVEVAGPDRAPHAVDGHHLLVQQRVRILEEPHAAAKQLLEVPMSRVL